MSYGYQRTLSVDFVDNIILLGYSNINMDLPAKRFEFYKHPQESINKKS